MTVGKAVAIGVGVAATAAGAYYLFGPKGKAHQKKAKALVVKMKSELNKQIRKVKSASQPVYHSIVDAISKAYSKEYKEHIPEINALARELKGQWKSIQNKTKPSTRKVKVSKNK